MDAADDTIMFLLRHGATDNNLAVPPRLQGRRTDPGLSVDGLRQSGEAAELLRAWPIRAVYASPLRRAQETAAVIAQPHRLAVVACPAITECDVGEWEGLTWRAIAAAHPEAHARFIADPAMHPYLGGESLTDVRDRVRGALDALLDDHAGQALVVVAHNVVNRAYLAGYLGVPLAAARGIAQANCGVNVLRRRDGRTRLLTLNAQFHLSGWNDHAVLVTCGIASATSDSHRSRRPPSDRPD
jgi:broad specificity phosphatase PhoE